jgi:hypothetical protein
MVGLVSFIGMVLPCLGHPLLFTGPRTLTIIVTAFLFVWVTDMRCKVGGEFQTAKDQDNKK